MNANVAVRRGQMDISILAVTAMLTGTGLIMVSSASTILAMNMFGDAAFFIKRQLIWSVAGFGAMVWLARRPYTDFRKWVGPGLLAAAILLLAVLLLSIGKTAGGARRWLSVGPLSFQPAEWLKVAVVLYLADALARKQKMLDSFVQGVMPMLLVLAAVAALLLLQPDLGTALILGIVACAMIYAAGARFSHLVSLALAAAPVLFMLIFHVGYRRRRWDAFLDPWQDPLGRGFQMVQSFLALGSGGLWGRGLAESQQKLFYLPAPHTDFIYSILGEELGFAGTFTVLLLFWFLVWKGIAVARRCADPFGKLLALGLTMLLGVQAVINMGVTTGLVPTKGTTLPFVSAGGSSLFFSLAAVGMLLSISRSRSAGAQPAGEDA